MADKDTSAVLIDSTPALHPTAQASEQARRDSLEKHLQQRPDPQELKEKHILLDTKAAPALQSAQYDLERQMATDSLKKGLGQRPERDELVGRNVLANSTAAPALQSHQRELEAHMRKDGLERALQSRPKPQDLVEGGILQADENPIKESK